ncbi:DUF4391 domain-containing protein [Bacillus sp. PS06]|nr:DUF4391 domain-containing protein [Bacillus sp. PS06]
MFYDFADINKKEKTAITKYIERMELTYLLTPTTINIQAFINEEYHYEGVMIVTAHLKDGITETDIRVLEEVIHRALPHPVVITFSLQNKILLSTCMKRLNKVNKTNVVLGTIHQTNWIDGEMSNSVVTPFLQSLQLIHLSFINFYEFYKDIDMAVEAFQNTDTIGAFKIIKEDEEREEQKSLIHQIQETEQSIARIKTAIKKETQFNKKVELNIKVQELTRDMENLKNNVSKGE